jgi:hypothetical protein
VRSLTLADGSWMLGAPHSGKSVRSITIAGGITSILSPVLTALAAEVCGYSFLLLWMAGALDQYRQESPQFVKLKGAPTRPQPSCER